MWTWNDSGGAFQPLYLSGSCPPAPVISKAPVTMAKTSTKAAAKPAKKAEAVKAKKELQKAVKKETKKKVVSGKRIHRARIVEVCH